MNPRQLLASIVTVFAFLVLSRIIHYLLTKWVGKLTSLTETDLDDRIIKVVKKPLMYSIIVLGVHYGLGFLKEIPPELKKILAGAIFIIGLVLVVYMVYKVLDVLFSWYASRAAEKTGTHLENEFVPLVRKVLTLFIFLIALIIALKRFNYDILSLVTAMGVGSLVLGLAAKDTIANMISGFTIMIDRPFRIGDRIRLSSGELGHVTDIGIRSTKVETFDHTIIIIPNSEMVTSKVTNYHYPDNKFKGKIEVGIAYGSNVGKAKDIMSEIALSVPGVIKDPAPQVYFIGFGDSSLNLMMRYWVDELGEWFGIQDDIHTRIHTRFEEEGIEIPFPIRTVYMKNENKK